MEERILDILQNSKNKMTFTYEELIRMLQIIGTKNINKFKKCLTRLISDAKIYYDYSDNNYMLFENSHMHKGILKIDDKKRYYIVENGSKIIVSFDNLHHASYGDFVLVNYNMKEHGYEISKVLKKDNNKYVGTIFKDHEGFHVSNDKFNSLDIISSRVNLLDGNIVLFEKDNGEAKILEYICHKDDANAETLRVVYEHGFTNNFDDAVKDEIANIPMFLDKNTIDNELLNGRVDMRDKDIVTIDCDSTKDIDDAVYIENNDDGTMSLYVCIADVAYYIKDGSSLSSRIKESGTSVYPPGCVIPMLPRELSNGICSLNPNVDRFAVCFKSTFDEFGNLRDFDVFKTIINSKKKMTYSNVDKILENDEMAFGYEKFHKQLLMMEKLYLIIQNNFYKNGYLKFENPELNFLLDSNDKIEEIGRNIQGTGAKIIEFFMLITNKNACEYFSNKGIPLVYRIDDEPNFRKISDVIDMLQKKNYLNDSFKVFSDEELEAIYSKEELQDVLSSLKDAVMPEAFYQMLIRAMSKAKFSTTNIGHYPLGLSHYAQFTSPIRRGGDWRNHTILDYYLSCKDADATRKRFPNNLLLREAEVYSEREREAEAVECEVNQMLLLEYLDNNVDKINNIPLFGRVSAITNCIRILLDNGIKGKIDIPTEGYKIDGNDLYINNNFICSVGDLVNVKLLGVKFKTKEILFSLEENLEKEYNLNGKETSEEKIKIRKYIPSI